MSTICIQIPESTVQIITYGAIAAIISTLLAIVNMICPFISNIPINRRINMVNGLLRVANEQMTNINNGQNLP